MTLRKKIFSKGPGCFIIIILLLLCSCEGRHSWHKEQGMIWHTIWHATYQGNPGAIAAAIDSLASVDASLNTFEPTSLVAQFNSGEACKPDAHLAEVYDISKRVNRLSGGMFDPTITPLVEAWGFGKNRTPDVDSAAISTLLNAVGIEKTWMEGGILHKANPSIAFNFSAIAKGYGVDKAAEALEKKGVDNLMFEIGGEVVCRGVNPEGSTWRIMIETPDEEYLREEFGSDSVPGFGDVLIVELRDEALATSGNYRNYHKEGNRTFGHTISPLTGYPAESDILSASVIAPTCVLADAMATACMGLGSRKAMDMLDRAGLAGAFILKSGKVVMNESMRLHRHEEKHP